MERPLKLLLDYDEAAQALSLSRAALRDLVYKGRGPAVTKIGRRTFFAVKDLEAFVERHREAAPLPTPPRQESATRRRGRPTVADQIARERSNFGLWVARLVVENYPHKHTVLLPNGHCATGATWLARLPDMLV